MDRYRPEMVCGRRLKREDTYTVVEFLGSISRLAGAFRNISRGRSGKLEAENGIEPLCAALQAAA
jgi:hypothetical protein